MTSEMAAYKGGPSGSAGFADQIKKSKNGKQRRKDLQARDLVSAQDEDEGDAHRRKSRASPPKQNKKAAGGLETMGLPTHNRKRTGFDQWQDELKAGEDGHEEPAHLPRAQQEDARPQRPRHSSTKVFYA
mgnify:CR=1 FL=1